MEELNRHYLLGFYQFVNDSSEHFAIVREFVGLDYRYYDHAKDFIERFEEKKMKIYF